MYRLTTPCLFRLMGAFALCLPILASPAHAQESNVLGLPAVPQPRPGAAGGPTNPASTAKTPTGSTPSPTPSRDALAGEMGLQHSALNGLGRLVVTTRATYATAGAKSNAIDAARSVQRELGKSCLKQCQPQKMAAPKILASGQLEYELVFRPLHQHLNQAQFLAVLQSRPLNLTPAQLAPPAVATQAPTQALTAPAPAISATQ